MHESSFSGLFDIDGISCLASDKISNLNMVFCPTIKSGFFSSLNTFPLIYAGIGYNNQNIINEKQ